MKLSKVIVFAYCVLSLITVYRSAESDFSITKSFNRITTDNILKLRSIDTFESSYFYAVHLLVQSRNMYRDTSGSVKYLYDLPQRMYLAGEAKKTFDKLYVKAPKYMNIRAFRQEATDSLESWKKHG